VIERALSGCLHVRTDPLASPTGFPFKAADLPGTLADAKLYAERERVCDAGYLRTPYRKPDGEVGYRCPAEPPVTYLRKGGKLEETLGRCCLCNGLIAAIGLGQRRRDGTSEPPIVTMGQDLSFPLGANQFFETSACPRFPSEKPDGKEQAAKPPGSHYHHVGPLERPTKEPSLHAGEEVL
jgi:hypothetical protein